jgi:hypothetical protein
MQDAVFFELTQLVGEDLLGDFGELTTELGEAAGAEGKMPEDLDLPFPGHHVDGSLDGTAMMVFHIGILE